MHLTRDALCHWRGNFHVASPFPPRHAFRHRLPLHPIRTAPEGEFTRFILDYRLIPLKKAKRKETERYVLMIHRNGQ